MTKSGKADVCQFKESLSFGAAIDVKLHVVCRSATCNDVWFAVAGEVGCQGVFDGDPAILDTLARCYAEKNQYDMAVEIQTTAIAAADGDMKDELQKTLDGYKTNVAK